jgi:hypothetical protein
MRRSFGVTTRTNNSFAIECRHMIGAAPKAMAIPAEDGLSSTSLCRGAKSRRRFLRELERVKGIEPSS